MRSRVVGLPSCRRAGNMAKDWAVRLPLCDEIASFAVRLSKHCCAVLRTSTRYSAVLRASILCFVENKATSTLSFRLCRVSNCLSLSNCFSADAQLTNRWGCPDLQRGAGSARKVQKNRLRKRGVGLAQSNLLEKDSAASTKILNRSVVLRAASRERRVSLVIRRDCSIDAISRRKALQRR
jgi:hypothetical protein